ncbi:hypothetical protein F4810DRAFT_700414 [Camillea tinctor]|nr:hypothetical protein F4810DRAFT_700414 [Camillea tinctor]
MAFHLIDTSTLRLTFVADKLPYAILSHTWENCKEVSFQEMVAINEDPSHPASKKSGYSKIVKTCEIAKSQGIPYVWVDTCCIDKTSSSVLNEAINAMYRWYQEAQVCYALLSDFDSGCAIESWCLQELIAPKAVLFFDAGWNSIGSKADLTSLISKITSIDRDVLVDSSSMGSVPRVTTREEDLAYCLLGIFDVNMPMLYGEGSKAFIRLQEEIIKSSNDLSIFAIYKSPSKEVDDRNDRRQSYCSLFATSPRRLYFPRVEMQVEVRHGLYSLPLNCKPSGVGPGLYARVDVGLSLHDDEEVSYAEVENAVYIIKEITPQYAIAVRSRSHDLLKALQVMQRSTSSDRWDASRQLFLTRGEKSFTGFWKVFPNFARKIDASSEVSQVPSTHYYLVCGLNHSHASDTGPFAWVRLLSFKEWTDLGNRYGILSNTANAGILSTEDTDAQLVIGSGSNSLLVTATIQLVKSEGRPLFSLELNMKENQE